jgi:septum site-determining protein MinD
LLEKSDVAEAYKDVIERFLGKDVPMRFTEAVKPGLLQRVFGRR